MSESNSSIELKRKQLASAVIDAFHHRSAFTPAWLSKNHPTVDRRRVTEILSAIPADSSPNTDLSLSLTRKVYKHIGVDCTSVYTDDERRRAIFLAGSKQWKQPMCEAELGVPPRTISRDLSDLRASFGFETPNQLKDKCLKDEDSVKTAINLMKFESGGKQPFLTQTEVDIFCEIASMADDAGFGMGRRTAKV